MKFSRSLVSAATFVAMLAGTASAQVEIIQLRTGNALAGSLDPQVNSLTGWGNSSPSAAFSASDFQTARTGGGVYVASAPAGWVSSSFSDPSARYVGTGVAATPLAGKSALYAIDFYLSNPNPQAANAFLTYDVVGNGTLGGGPTGAVYINGQPVQLGTIPIGTFTSQTFAISNISSVLRSGLNTIYFNHVNPSTTQGGLMVSARIQVGDATPCPKNWTSLANATGPGPTGVNGAVYDSARDRVVLFRSAAGTRETWEYDGATWTIRSTIGPSPRLSAAMAYDPIRQRTILFGGNLGSGGSPFVNDLWEWNGTAWTEIQTTGGPTGRENAAAAFDPARGRIVFAGGFNGSVLNETWAWNGSAWSRLLDMPAQRYAGGMAYDASQARMVYFGGYAPGSTLQIVDDTYAFDGTRWSTLAPVVSPSPRAGASIAFDATQNSLVLFGGITAGLAVLNDTWSFSGGTWNPLVTAASPVGQFKPAMVFDSTRGRVVIQGGQGPGGSSNTSFLSAGSPSFTLQPQPVSITEGQTINLSVGFVYSPSAVIRWRKNGQTATNGQSTLGVGTSALSIPAASRNDSGVYDAVLTGSCGTTVSQSVVVQVSPCYANCDGSTVAPVLGASDFSCFLSKYRAGCPAGN